MKNYICINGNKTELTEEQLKQLGIELPKANPFDRGNRYDQYYMIAGSGDVDVIMEHKCPANQKHFDAANYCTDKYIMEQRALHETLNRLLWRYSMTHKGNRVDDKVWSITYHADTKTYHAGWVNYQVLFVAEVAFDTEEIAQNAIEEIVKPFIEAHPDFKF